MFEFTVDGHDYRAVKLDAFQQLHVSRKLAGVLAKSIPALLGAEANADDLAVLIGSFEPAAAALAAMPAEDVDYVCHECLALVTRKQDVIWSPVWSKTAKRLMFEDIDMAVMMQLVMRVVEESLGSFIRGLTARLRQASPTAAE
jgi:hypothetical protein